MIRSWAKNFIKNLIAVAPAVYTAAIDGNEIDTHELLRGRFSIMAGTITDGVQTFKVQECATSGGTFTDVDGGQILVDGVQGTNACAFAVDDDDEVKNIDVLSTLKYIKLVSTVTGASTGGLFAANFVADPKIKD